MIRQWCVGAPLVVCRPCNNQTSIDYRPIDCSRWMSAIYIGQPIVGWHMDWYLGRYSSKTEDPTIINLRDCSRGFHFCAIFHIADVLPLPDRCSVSRLAVQFPWSFWWFWRPSWSHATGSCQASALFHATVSYLQDVHPWQRSPFYFWFVESAFV